MLLVFVGEWKNCEIECSVPGQYCVHPRPTCPDVLVGYAVDAPLT
jgi:hypothetical protein